MPPKREAGAAAAAVKDTTGRGTFSDMFAGDRSDERAGADSAWSRPRPVAVEEVDEGEEVARELAEVVERDYDPKMLDIVFNALDYVVPTLGKTNDQAIYMLMVRRSYGRGKNTCLVNLPFLADRTNISITGVRYVLARLKKVNLIKERRKSLGRGIEQGVEYEVLVPVRR
jgi:hypothetical protein